MTGFRKPTMQYAQLNQSLRDQKSVRSRSQSREELSHFGAMGGHQADVTVLTYNNQTW